MTTKQLRVCVCEGRYMRPDNLYCSVKCVHNDPLRSDRVQIKSCTVDELNNLPNGLRWVFVYLLERNEYDTLKESVEPVTGGYIMKRDKVTNLPPSLDELTIYWSCIEEEDIRVPYDCKLYVRNAYDNPVYPERYDAMCHLFKYTRDGIMKLSEMDVFKSSKNR